MENSEPRDHDDGSGGTGPSSEELLASARREWLGGDVASTSEEMTRAARDELKEGVARPELVIHDEPETREPSPRPAPPVTRQRSQAERPTAPAPSQYEIPPAEPPPRPSPTTSPRAIRLTGLIAFVLIIGVAIAANVDEVSWFAEPEPDPGTTQPATGEEGSATETTVPASQLINLARAKPITASGEYEVSVARRAIDGNLDTGWNSGGFPPQWIIVDLGAPRTIYSIELVVAQSPPGETTHELVVWGPDRDGEVVHVFSEHTSNWQHLTFQPDAPLTGVQAVGIATVESPSWVAWKEIEIMGPLP